MLPFARAPQSLCFFANLTHSSQDVGGITVHRDNSYLVSGELSHRKALSVAKLIGQEHSVRQLHTSDSHWTTSAWYPPLGCSSRPSLCQALESSCRDLWGSCLTCGYVCRAAQAQVLRLGWWINTSLICVTNLIAGPQGCLRCTPTDGLAEKDSATVRPHSKLCLPARGRVPILLCLTHWPSSSLAAFAEG